MVAGLILIMLSISMIAYLSYRPSTWAPSTQQKLALASYLKSDFTEEIGLIYKSEDNGANPNAPGYSQQKIPIRCKVCFRVPKFYDFYGVSSLIF